ncbi:hypothetical protein [Bradyrhizobium cenepequi]|uniref:hypothetical protein n=1 Tax=Bradyrhizobium cenepequi TaxID=2821403 RepID=UPI001CE2DB54|nr:hypothetical protein [Bradyrhizobium cenepequi]MCA6109590.1 hypothetical protein [Bradyrhizobium cenepequi]
MELGTAVFLSSIAVSVVLLYGFTKDRWSWRRIIRRSVGGIFMLGAIGGVLIVAAQYWDQLFPVRLSRQAEYAGLRLGMSRDEVKYVKGFPANVVTDDKEGPWQDFGVLKSSELPKGKTVNDYPLWSYEGYEHYLHVAFGNGKTVLSIACFSKDRLYRCPAIGGVQDGSSEAELVRKLGAPSKSQIKDTTKSVEYDDIGVEFKLEKETVYRLLVGQTPLL